MSPLVLRQVNIQKTKTNKKYNIHRCSCPIHRFSIRSWPSWLL